MLLQSTRRPVLLAPICCIFKHRSIYIQQYYVCNKTEKALRFPPCLVLCGFLLWNGLQNLTSVALAHCTTRSCYIRRTCGVEKGRPCLFLEKHSGPPIYVRLSQLFSRMDRGESKTLETDWLQRDSSLLDL